MKLKLKFFALLCALLFLCSCEDKQNTSTTDNGGTSGSSSGSSGSSTNPITTPDPNGSPPSGGETFLIKEGNHYHTGIDGGWGGRRYLARQAYFYADTAYESVTPANQFDINKLTGFSDCGAVFSNHNNSARFGWNWDPITKMIKLHAYTYVNGDRQYSYIKSVPLKTVVTLSLTLDGYFYIFQADAVTVKMPRHCDSNRAWGWLLFPYFGGDETAPHNMHIWLKVI